MTNTTRIEIQDLPIWEAKNKHAQPLYSFDIELTARCNNNCRHCYINLPANDREAQARELTLEEIADIADQALDLGAMWVLLTGGEPLLRRDFTEIYMMLKRKGLLVSVFTNATIIRPEHIALFKKYPPRDIEVTIYGASQETYEAVSRLPGSYQAFVRGLEALLDAGIRIRLKAMALRSNLMEIEEMSEFGRRYTKDFYRFDPVLHLRYDRDEARNDEIRSERLTPEEVVALELADRARFEMLERDRNKLIMEKFKDRTDTYLFTCGVGNGTFSVAYDGTFRLCSSLHAPGTTADLRQVRLQEVWQNLVPKVRRLRTDNQDYLDTCGKCEIINLCMNCPAHAYLETGAMDAVVPYFCAVAHTRAKLIDKSSLNQNEQAVD